MFPIGTVVIHKSKSEFGYGIVVQNFEKEGAEVEPGETIAVVLWHGDEEIGITEMPQIHSYSELKVLNTTVGFA